MIKIIMAVDEKGGISKGKACLGQKTQKTLTWFKEKTLNNVVIMGRKTWEDPFMPTPLKSRINILVTNKDAKLFPGSDSCISGNINEKIKKLESQYNDRDLFIIGGSEIINITFEIIQQFYLTRIYGNYNCEKFLNLSLIENNMKLIKKLMVIIHVILKFGKNETIFRCIEFLL